MVAAIRIEVHGAAAIERQLTRLADRFGDLTPLMEVFGLVLETQVSERFEGETAPDGSTWKKSIRAREQGGKTLTDTSQLKSSITSNVHARSVEVGTNKIYAGVHQFGATIRAKAGGKLAFNLPGGLGFRRVDQVEIPKREFLGLSIGNEAELLDEAEAWALDAAGGLA